MRTLAEIKYDLSCVEQRLYSAYEDEDNNSALIAMLENKKDQLISEKRKLNPNNW